jgi:hypothetical protein
LPIAAIVAPLAACFGPSHPDHERYEYMYIHGVFQPPYKEFPTGVARSDWKCFDEKVEREYDCTFVRGGWNQYHYIYRARR